MPEENNALLIEITRVQEKQKGREMGTIGSKDFRNSPSGSTVLENSPGRGHKRCAFENNRGP